MSYREKRFLGHEWGDLPMIFTSDEVTSENYRQIASRVTPKIVIHGNECIGFFFLHAVLCPEDTIPLKRIIDNWFRHCRWGRSFLTYYCDVTTVDLWRHANISYWQCYVIFVDCSCTRKLAQKRSSLVNNSREYRFLATRYSRLSV